MFATDLLLDGFRNTGTTPLGMQNLSFDDIFHILNGDAASNLFCTTDILKLSPIVTLMLPEKLTDIFSLAFSGRQKTMSFFRSILSKLSTKSVSLSITMMSDINFFFLIRK